MLFTDAKEEIIKHLKANSQSKWDEELPDYIELLIHSYANEKVREFANKLKKESETFFLINTTAKIIVDRIDFELAKFLNK